MDFRNLERLVERLVANPHDEEALAQAYDVSASDLPSYADLLERVGAQTVDPVLSSYWFTEAGNVWLDSLKEDHKAAALFKDAIEKDPTQSTPAQKLAEIYRSKEAFKELCSLFEWRIKALERVVAHDPRLGDDILRMHEELGSLLSQPPFSQPKKAIEHLKKVLEADPGNTYAIHHAREAYKALGAFQDAFALYERELSLSNSVERKVLLLRDEAKTRKATGDLPGTAKALGKALALDETNDALKQEYAGSILERKMAGENVPAAEVARARELLLDLAQSYEGEFAYSYAGGVLDLDPGSDRAFEIVVREGKRLGDTEGLVVRSKNYLRANGKGTHRSVAEDFAKAHVDGKVEDMPTANEGPDERLVERSLPSEHVKASTPPPPLSKSADVASSKKGAAVKAGKEAPKLAVKEAQSPAKDPPRDTKASKEPAKTEAVKPSATTSQKARDAGETKDEKSDLATRPVSLEAAPPVILSADRIPQLMESAQASAQEGKRMDAYQKYREVLEIDAAHAEALDFVEDCLRATRDYATLRDVLNSAVRAMRSNASTIEARKRRLREIANLCEGNLRDVDGAIVAWKELLLTDRSDDHARQAFARLLERAGKLDDLATHLEEEAQNATDLDTKIAFEKRAANLHEQKRSDFAKAGECWARIARLVPDDDRAIGTAARNFERAGLLDRAIHVLSTHSGSVDDPNARGLLFEHLGELRERVEDRKGAAEAFSGAARLLKTPLLWEKAERNYVGVENWKDASDASCERAALAQGAKEKGVLFAKGAVYANKAKNEARALELYMQASELDPPSDEYADFVTKRLRANVNFAKLVEFLAARAGRLSERSKRVSLRREAAHLAGSELSDHERARDLWTRILEDGEDRESLERLIELAVERGDHVEAATLLRRLGALATDNTERVKIALREAEILADGIGDSEAAIARYEFVLADLDPTCRPALQAIADLQEARENIPSAADALERELKLVVEAEDKIPVALRLARLYEAAGDVRSAIRALDIVRKGDPDDYDTLARLTHLCEQTEQWDRVSTLLAEQIEVEGDEKEAIAMTKKLAQILADRLNQGEEALSALTSFADRGDGAIRTAYVELGDRLGWRGLVATKLVDWWIDGKQSGERTNALRGAFDRFVSVGRDQDAVKVGVEVVKAQGGDLELATRLEEIAARIQDIDALSLAQDILVLRLTGQPRAQELVRQAHIRAKAGVSREEGVQYGEQGLAGLTPVEAEPLLASLATLLGKPAQVIEIYERQVSRYRSQHDRVSGLAKAAQIAASHGEMERARGFFELALVGTPSEDTLVLLESVGKAGDDKLKRALCAALSQGGGGARDGGRTRAALLRRAAKIAEHELVDMESAFNYLGDALIAFVDQQTLAALDELGLKVADFSRAEAVVSRALTEVFDGTLVRQLLSRRAILRRDKLNDKSGALQDFKKLHDIATNDPTVLYELSNLTRDLGDYRGLVQIYEDEILRGKDVGFR
ncbi:MAG: hypothetical protein KBF88_08240, partial [Polyangiaceae bacterium]|nr:hypothetical protein [Polyangiaceae bacterium]